MNGGGEHDLGRINREFRLQREVMQAVLDAAPAAILVADTSGAILLASPTTERLLGGPVTGNAHGPAGGYTLSWPDGSPIPKGQLPLSRALAGETVSETELVVNRVDGSQTIILATAAPLKTEAGEIWGAVSVFQDITASRRTDEELRKAQGDSMRFPDENPSPVFRVSAEGKVLYRNPVAERHPALQLEGEKLPKPLQDLIGPVLREAYPVTRDVELEGRTFSVSFAPFPEESYVNLYTRDITDRKRAEEALRESEERLRLALAAADLGIWDLDLKTDTAVRSLRHDQMFGYDEMQPQWGLEIALRHLVSEDREIARKALARARKTGEVFHEVRVLWPNGSIHWIAVHGRTYYDKEGQPVRIAGTVADITDRKQAEEALQRAHGLLQAITQGTHNLIAAQDDQFRYLFFNEAYRRAFKRLWGRDLEIGSSMVEAMAPWAEERRKAMELWSRALGGESFSVKLDFGPAEREKQIYQLSFNPIYDEQGRKLGAAHIMQNVTEQVRMESALRELNETLEARVAERTAEVELQSDRLRALASELSRAELRERKRLAKILHDHIQQLIVAARMQLEWIKRDMDRNQILATAQGANGILREALEASRSLTFDLSPPVLNESGLVGALSWQAARILEKHHLKVHLRLDSKAEPVSEEIRFLVFECARELLFNAVKHAGVADVQLTLSLAPRNQLRLVVSDEGHGFDPTLLENRQPSELTFGLFSVQERLAHIGGRMLIETSLGKGTRITLTAPIGKVETVSVKTPPRTSPGGEGGIRIRSKTNLVRVLIVDDHKIMRQGLVGLLQFEPGIEVVGEAADALQAVELAEELDPDVITMDVNLNGMNGVEATRVILSRNPGIKVIGLSMHTDSSVSAALREAGAVAYLTKGGPSEDLVAAIRACCGGEPVAPG